MKKSKTAHVRDKTGYFPPSWKSHFPAEGASLVVTTRAKHPESERSYTGHPPWRRKNAGGTLSQAEPYKAHPEVLYLNEDLPLSLRQQIYHSKGCKKRALRN